MHASSYVHGQVGILAWLNPGVVAHSSDVQLQQVCKAVILTIRGPVLKAMLDMHVLDRPTL